jgi:hypothetical protein
MPRRSTSSDAGRVTAVERRTCHEWGGEGSRARAARGRNISWLDAPALLALAGRRSGDHLGRRGGFLPVDAREGAEAVLLSTFLAGARSPDVLRHEDLGRIHHGGT